MAFAGIFAQKQVATRSTKATRSGPVTRTRPMCPRSNRPAFVRTVRTSSRIGPYCTGMCQPPNSTILPPDST